MLPVILERLAANGLDLLTKVVTAKGTEWIKEKTGVDVTAAELSPSDLVALHRFEIENALELQKIALETLRMDYADVADARKAFVDINNSHEASWLAKNLVPAIALVVVIGGMIILCSEDKADVRMAVNSFITIILGFLFGSSKNNQNKDETIKKLLSKGDTK